MPKKKANKIDWLVVLTALALSPANDLKVQALTFIGLGEDALKRPQRAEAAFRDALAANRKLPNPNPGTVLEFAMFLTRQSRQGEAQKLLDEILTSEIRLRGRSRDDVLESEVAV